MLCALSDATEAGRQAGWQAVRLPPGCCLEPARVLLCVAAVLRLRSSSRGLQYLEYLTSAPGRDEVCPEMQRSIEVSWRDFALWSDVNLAVGPVSISFSI